MEVILMDQRDKKKEIYSTDTLFLIFFLGGLSIAFLSAIFLPQPITGKPYEFIIGSVVLFLWGTGGLIIFRRKELLQLGLRIRGNPAMSCGVFIMMTCWLLALLFIYMALQAL